MSNGSRRDREYTAGERIPGTEYVVVRMEAQGGHGALYLVRHHFLEKKIQMLKTLRAFEPSHDLTERLKREAQMLAGMDHPHIVSVVSGGLTDEPKPRPYFVMERLRGRSLAEVLPRAPRGIGLAATLQIATELAGAVDYVHREHALVHRDIKPDNVFIHLTPTGITTKLLDFGVLHILFLDERQTHERAFIGTPRYASPEQLFGDRPSPQTDLYALGLLIYELATGSHPFEDCATLAAFAKAHLDRTPPPFSERVGAPKRLEELVFAMLAKDPRDRPLSAEHVRLELREIVERVRPDGDRSALTALVRAVKREEPAKAEAPMATMVTTSAPNELSYKTRPTGRKEGLLGTLLAATLVGLAITGVWAVAMRPPTEVTPGSVGSASPRAVPIEPTPVASALVAPAPKAPQVGAMPEATPTKVTPSPEMSSRAAQAPAETVAAPAPALAPFAVPSSTTVAPALERADPSSAAASPLPKGDVKRTME